MVRVLEVFWLESVLSSLGPDHGGSFPASLPLLACCQTNYQVVLSSRVKLTKQENRKSVTKVCDKKSCPDANLEDVVVHPTYPVSEPPGECSEDVASIDLST